MFNELFNQMVNLAEASKSKGLFSSFNDDLYIHDKDIVLNDLQVNDRYLWIIKEFGTYLTLVQPGNEYLDALLSTIQRDGLKRQYFIITVHPERCDISEVPVADVAAVVSKLPFIKNRVPKRQFAHSLLCNAFPSLRGSIMFSDHSFEKGAELFLSLTSNSVTYVSMASFKARTLSVPFDVDRTGYLKLTVTSEFGHGILEPITARSFNFALKKSVKRAA